jgi:hypothetical protein
MKASSSRAWIVAALGLCFAAQASANSDEAIADGEALLAATKTRASFGEVTFQDLSVVRYYLLELRMAAGKMPRETFCSEAQAELRTMIASDGDEETKAGLAQRRDKVEDMTQSSERCQQAVTAIDDFLFGSNVSVGSVDKVAAAEKALADARQKYRDGDIERTDLLRAEADLIDAQYGSGKLAKEAYCASGQAASLSDLTKTVEQLAQVGQAGLLERIAAKRRYWAFKAQCPAK